MGLNSNQPKFARKPINGNVYQWQPQVSIANKRSTSGIQTNSDKQNNTGCSVIAYTLGYDDIVTYVYNPMIIASQSHHGAYVVCDYVQ